MIERHDFHTHVAFAFFLRYQTFTIFCNLLLAVGFRHIVGHALEHCVGDILYVVEEQNRKSFVGKFLVFAVSPEAVFEVVVFHGGVSLHLAEATVVIGEQQSLGGDELAGAATAELHNGVLQAGLVETEDLFSSQFTAKSLHVS